MNKIIRDRETGCFIIGPKNINSKIDDTFFSEIINSYCPFDWNSKP